MRRPRLSTFLVIINVGVLLLAVAGVAVAAAQLLRQFADEQALARVTQANTTARQELQRAGEDALISARLLGERPTLQRLLQTRQIGELTQFLAQFQQTSQLDGCAVLRDGQVVAASGAALPWHDIAAQPNKAGEFLYRAAPNNALIQGAAASVASISAAQVLVARVLDDAFTARLSSDLGVAISIEPERTTTQSAARRDDLGLYQARGPLIDQAGATVGTIVATLPTTSLAQSLQQLSRTLLLIALAVAVLAGLTSFLLGQRLARPLQALTSAAARIGRGDMTTPIGVAPGGEIGTLASTLEEMRWRLLRLTADLRRQQAESQAIITGITEGVFSVDRERRIRYVNPQAAALLGLQADTMIGRFCGDVLKPQLVNGARPCAEHCPIIHARFRDGAHATEHVQLAEGGRRTVVITSAPFADEQQVQVMRDETERETVRRLRDTVLANISHEFRTPLSAQLASIELLLDQLPTLTTDEIGQLILALQRGTLRLTQLIDNLLESARIEAGRFAIRQRPLALDEVVEAALELTRPLLTQRNQQVALELPFPLPLVSGDAPLLTQVFVNLLANANKFAPAGSTITIGGDVTPASVTLWVADQGPGMPQSQEGALFGQFIRSVGDEPEQSGVGLGLWIVQTVIERHGGTVTAQNNAAGAQVRVTLPRPAGW